MKTKDIEALLNTYSGDRDCRKTAEEMDELREKTVAYEYLCHLEEAKKWMEACLREPLPPSTELEENLRNGVYLAKLGHYMAPDVLPFNKIYDVEQKRYSVAGLQFRHTDNINHFLKCLRTMQLPLTFQPETTDIYDKKNMPRLIYCIHALSTHLFKLGKAPQIQDLYGKVNFTDAEIDAVSKELQKYKIKMPSFQKIGGLLTNTVPGDLAALHAAVIAVNEDLLTNTREEILPKLLNSAIQLKNVNPDYVNFYYETLKEAKEIKAQGAMNRSLNDSYVPDAYDELLTQAEIQGHINNVNFQCALEILVDCVNRNPTSITSALKNPILQLKSVSAENSEIYKKEFKQLFDSNEWQEYCLENCQYWQKKLQGIIDSSNLEAQNLHKKDEAVQLLNQVLEKGLKDKFLEVLTNPRLGVFNIVEQYAMPLYYEEMRIDRSESKKDLSLDDIVVSIRVLSSIASISKAVDTNNHDLLYEALKNPEAHIINLDQSNKVKYCCALAAIRKEKLRNNEDCPLLTYIDIQECVDLVNGQCMEDDKVINVLKDLNIAVNKNCRIAVMNALRDASLKLKKPTSPEDATLYLKLFKKCLNEKHTDGSELWLEDVEEITKFVSLETENVQAACTSLVEINIAIDRNDFMYTIDCLQSMGINISEKYRLQFYNALRNLKDYKSENYFCPFIKYKTPGGNEAIIDLQSCNYTWDLPKDLAESCFITKSDIENLERSFAVSEIPSKVIKLIIRLQAHIRGYLLRKKISDKFSYYYDNIDKIVKIQALFRGYLTRKMYLKLLEHKKKFSDRDVRRMVKIEAKYQRTMDYYREHEDNIIKIQALWRGRAARKVFHALLYLDKPPFPVVRHFASILNFNSEDYEKDLKLQQLKNEVVQLIKHNQNLSQQLDSMDIKIGLLIQNRIALSEVVDHGKDLEHLTKEKGHRNRKNSFSESSNVHKGLKSLTKEGRKMLDGYQHLFYALQTNPAYLSRLLFLLPQSKSNKFLQGVVLKLFNYGSSLREEYLLLKLLGSALREEIRSKFQKPSEVVTGNPLVLKMAVDYARQVTGQRALREILAPIIEKILSDKSIAIETNPVDIYKCWRNRLEMETGETLDLPYSVTQQQALQYEQVQKRLDRGIRLLKTTVSELLNRITSSRNLIPYGMLYMAKVLHDTLGDKFPNAPEKDILKVVGNLIYYHFINAAIVAPDAFDIITLTSERSLSNDQRRNLASIAKILQFAASKKGFGEEAPHLICLNPFIISCHEKFKVFFSFCCEIEDLDDHFSIHEYTEATLIEKPEIYVSLQEIVDTHDLFVQYQDQIAPDPLDPLHELLEDLGPLPTVATLLGLNDPVTDASLVRYGKTEVCLVLSNKFEVPDCDDSNLNSLFIKTKELLVSVIQFLRGETLDQALEIISSPVQEKLYGVRHSVLLPSQKSESLKDCKNQLRAYLNKLELGGYVSRGDGYQTIITAVAKDLCNKGHYRQLRNKEFQMLRTTKQRLEEKSNYYKEQVKYYNEYIKHCLESLHTGKGTLRAIKTSQKLNEKRLKSKLTLKYSAAKLQEKGVLLEIDGLPPSQFKNVIFEISPTEQTGVFTVKGKFMGVQMEKLDINIQKLLELQFEGSPIMDMFGKAKINVNLLLHLLNRKFYYNK